MFAKKNSRTRSTLAALALAGTLALGGGGTAVAAATSSPVSKSDAVAAQTISASLGAEAGITRVRSNGSD